jgi:Uma2 family endonuclease
MRASEAPKLTYEDLVRLPDDGQRHELIDGEHYVTPSPVTVHQRLVGRLHLALSHYLEEHPIGEVFLAPLDIVLSPHDVVEPDLFLVLEEQADIVREPHVTGAPALVIEILSDGTRRRDEGIKRALYERVGVREYWLVDPIRTSVVICHRTDSGALAPGAPLLRGDILTSPLLPSFTLLVDDLFAVPRTGRKL